MPKTELIMPLTHPIYSDPHAAREHHEGRHWLDGPVCPRCGETERLKRAGGKSTRPGVVNCNPCRKPFTVTVGTIFEDSKIPLNKWLLGFRLMAEAKKGISAHQLHRSLGITYKSAWFMAHRIREAMDIDDGPLGGPDVVVEVDETYVGGKEKNKHRLKRQSLGRGAVGKMPVVALVERDGRVANRHVANITHKELRPLVVTMVDRASLLMTDEASVYTRMVASLPAMERSTMASANMSPSKRCTRTPSRISSRSSSAASSAPTTT